MTLRNRIAGYEHEAVFWGLVALSTGLYILGGPTVPVGGWILQRAMHALKFWMEVLGLFL